MEEIDQLARKITKRSSLQTYFTIRLLVDRDNRDNAYKAYAYFRWLDDQVDKYISNESEKSKFIQRQRELLNSAYANSDITNLSPYEELIVSLIHNDRSPKLKSYVLNFFSIIAFDSERKDRLVSEQKLNWYSETIGLAVTDCITHFIGGSTSEQENANQYKAATAAHIIHMLRDFREDLEQGIINIPKEYFQGKELDKNNLSEETLKEWVKNRADLAEKCFSEGSEYIKQIRNYKCRWAANCYCLRFRPLLNQIKREAYILRQNYQSPVNFRKILRGIFTKRDYSQEITINEAK